VRYRGLWCLQLDLGARKLTSRAEAPHPSFSLNLTESTAPGRSSFALAQHPAALLFKLQITEGRVGLEDDYRI
jgi:hypothetical protein